MLNPQALPQAAITTLKSLLSVGCVLGTLVIVSRVDTVFADELASAGAQSVIEGNGLGQVSGAFAVNIAAGADHIQSNAAAIAVSPATGVAIGSVTLVQQMGSGAMGDPGAAIARISGRPFANASGLIMINQTSGQGNAQANATAIVLSIEGEAMAESDLAQAVSDAGSPAVAGAASQNIRAVSVDDTAFEGVRGVVQLNQSAGSWNATANNFALQVSVDPNF